MSMLRSSNLRRQNIRSIICWKCCANIHTAFAPKGRQLLKNVPGQNRGGLVSKQNVQIVSRKHFSITHTAKAEIEKQDINSDNLPPLGTSTIPIRERLRMWEEVHAKDHISVDAPDRPQPGTLENASTRIAGEDFELDQEIEAEEDVSTFTQDDLVDVGSRRGFILPGDLVELIGMGQRVELAVHVSELHGKSCFYTISGKWITASPKSSQFYVPNFVEKDELDLLRPFLPTKIKNLNSKAHEVPRSLGGSLVKKMREFWSQSNEVYHSALSRFDNAHALVAHQDTFRYATLEELAKEILPLEEGDKHSYPALYAIHSSLLRDDLGFRPQLRGATRTGGQYEVSSRSEVLNSFEFVDAIRLMRGFNTKNSEWHDAIRGFGRLIDKSRTSRQLTSHGTIGPLAKPGDQPESQLLKTDASRKQYSKLQLKAIKFMESWVALKTIGRHSSIVAIGSAFLRAIGRYEGLPLNQSTAWTFLQEINFIYPWTNRVPFDLRVPKVGRVLQSESAGEIADWETEDTMLALRKEFDRLPVYCIDSANAHEIDDGVSVERTTSSDEYWVHIHTADPASRVHPDNSKSIASQVETIYLPEQVFFMIPSDFVQKNLSLGPNRPSLTFSAKMNFDGDILETKISAQTIHNVKNMTPSVVEEIISGTKLDRAVITNAVGPVNDSEGARIMLESHQLSEEEKEDLRILHKIGEGRVKQRRANGGVTMSSTRVEVSASFPSTVGENCITPTLVDERNHPDPSICLAKEESNGAMPKVDVVAPLMLIAAEVAARWCHERGIPVPYRVTPRIEGKDPLKFYRDVILPSLDSHGNPPMKIAIQYFRQLGTVIPSTIPGPHLGVGVEMMAKCTSPLRRYGDLILHWQVHAALREEARLGHDLIGNTKEDFLPFSKAKVDRILPHLEARERLIKRGNQDSTRHWLCHFLVRAWRFNEAHLPPKFEFVVQSSPGYNRVYGTLPYFDAQATMTEFNEFDPDEIKGGHKYEVELADVNVYNQTINVKALRRLE